MPVGQAIGGHMYKLLRPALFLSDAESAHGLSLAALRMMPLQKFPKVDSRLKQTVAGIDFPNPVVLVILSASSSFLISYFVAS